MKKVLFTVLFLVCAMMASARSATWHAFEVKGRSQEIEKGRKGAEIETEMFMAVVVTDDLQANGTLKNGVVVVYEKGRFWVSRTDTFDMDFYAENVTRGVTSVEITIDSPMFAGEILGFGRYRNRDDMFTGFLARSIGLGEDESGDDVSFFGQVRYNKKLTEKLNKKTSQGLVYDLAEYIASKAKVDVANVEEDLEGLLR